MSVQISVVIPTYKRPKLLLRCLTALLKQNFDRDKFEVIVVSDGPDTLTEQSICAFDHKDTFKLFYAATPEKKGPAAARNYGWLAAKGQLIAFTDDDCIPGNDWLLAYYQQYQLNSDCVFTGKTVVPIPANPTDYELNTAGLEKADFITANCACPKKILLNVGGFDEQFTMAWREDSDLEFKLIKLGVPIYRVERAVVTHPVRSVHWGVSIKEQRKTMYNALLYKKHPSLYRKKIQSSPPVLYYAIIICFLATLVGLVANKHTLFTTGLILWIGLSIVFAYRRLKSTTRRADHFFEMLISSIVIPFLSLYWQFYGAIKYRKLLL